MSIGKTLCRVGLGLLGAAAVAVIACNGGDKGVTPPEKKPWGGADMAAAKGTATAVDPTVTIDGLTWMQKNLDIETPDSWCYQDNPDICAIFGRLYTWEAAISACESLGDSWRLPDTADWNNLINYAGGEEVAGKKLRSETGWNSNTGTDDYGFSALPGGSRNPSGNFDNGAGYGGRWWSASESSGSAAYNRSVEFFGNVREYSSLKSFGFSARCVKKIESSPTSIREVERRIH